MSGLAIRRGAPSDMAAVQRLNYALFEYENSLGLYADSFNLDWTYGEAGAKYFQDRLGEMTPGVVLVAETHTSENPEVVGYLAANISRPAYRSQTIGEIENMFIVEPYRSHGAGTQLVDAFKDWARQNGATRLRVGSFAGNHDALEFYRHRGFTDFELWLEQSLDS